MFHFMLRVFRPNTVNTIMCSFHRQIDKLGKLEAKQTAKAEKLRAKADRQKERVRATRSQAFDAEIEAARADDMADRLRTFVGED